MDAAAQCVVYMAVLQYPHADAQELAYRISADAGFPVSRSWVERTIQKWGWPWTRRLLRPFMIEKYTDANVTYYAEFAAQLSMIRWNRVLPLRAGGATCASRSLARS